MVEETAALSASQTGMAIIGADFHIHLNTNPTGGGDRCFTEMRLVRTRATVDSVMVVESVYGPRAGGNFNNVGNDATRNASASIVWVDDVLEGDTFKIEARVGTQTQAVKNFTFNTTGNGIFVAGVS